MKREQVEIQTPYIKLDSFLKFAGAAVTGGQSKDLVLAGEAFVNGEKCLLRGKKLMPGDVVRCGGREFEVAAGAD